MSAPKARYIPNGAQAVTRDGVNAIVYTSAAPNSGRLWAIGYIGNSGRHAFNFTFRSAENMQKYITMFFDNAEHGQQVKAHRKQARAAFRHGFKVGDILHYSWGYEQTNCEFYQVTAATPGRITMRRIAGETVPGSEGFMSCSLLPVRDAFMAGEPEINKIPQPSGMSTDSPGVVAMEFGVATLHDEKKPAYLSWYA